MKFSKETITILKNFAAINGNVQFKPGSVLSTITPQRNIMASVTIKEVFPVEFLIYDLSQFLGVLSLFDDPDIIFEDDMKLARIKEGRTQIKYHAADKSVLVLPPEKQIKFPGADVSFTVTQQMISAIQKTGSVLSVPDVSFIGDGANLILRVSDIKSGSNAYEVELGSTDKTFSANIRLDSMKMLSQDYTVELSSKKISKWTAVNGDMTVYVALESSSTF